MLSDGYHDVPAGKVAMVVTYLEMRAAQYRDAALPDGLEFARITPDVTDYRELYARVGQDWLWFGRSLVSDAALRDIITDPAVHIFSLMQDGKAEALLELDFRQAGACELAYFGLTSALIGSGAGAYLMDRAVEKAFAQRIERLHVHTCSIDSPKALDFYRRSGFVPVQQKIEIADDPRIVHGYDRALAPHVPLFDA